MGKPSEKQLEIYNLVLEAQKIAFGLVEAGQRCAGVDAAVRQYFQKYGYDSYFGHGLGHGVGLRSMNCPPSPRREQGVLREMMVFSIEPEYT